MPTFSELPAAQPLLVLSAYLVLFMGIIGGLTANRRRLAGVVVNPEDVPLNPGSHTEPQEAEATLRAKRAHLNAVENIPGFLVLATLFTLNGASTTAGWAYFGVYAAARTLHAVFYLNGVQPWRTAAFAVGQFAMLGVAVQVVMAAF